MASKNEAWNDLKKRLPIGSHVRCKVLLHRPYGIQTEIEGIDFEGLVQITDFKDSGKMTPDEYPPVDTEIQAVVLGFKDAGMQIWLGMKRSQLSK